MWSVVLKILSILGIILLCLLGFLLLVLLLVLFAPVIYRGSGRAHDGEYAACFRFRWLFGLVRGEFAYPLSKTLRIKALWLTVFDSGGKRREKQENPRKAQRAAARQPLKETAGENAKTAADAADPLKTTKQKAKEQAQDREGAGPKNRLQRYLSVAQDRENQDLVKHALSRLGKIIKSIRPRELRAEAVVGLGEPDTTGYLYGAYWMLKPFLGKNCRITVTPDFEQQILEGNVVLRGRMITAVLLYQVVRVVVDKRLRKLFGQLQSL